MRVKREETRDVIELTTSEVESLEDYGEVADYVTDENGHRRPLVIVWLAADDEDHNIDESP